MTMFYGLQWTHTETGDTCLCEVESNVVYVIGTKLEMMLAANRANREAKEDGWPSRYRAVPLPFTGSQPFEADAERIHRVHELYRSGRINSNQYINGLRDVGLSRIERKRLAKLRRRLGTNTFVL